MKQRAADHECSEGPEGPAALYSLALLVVLFGVAGLLEDSWLKRLLGTWVNFHAMFGLLLWIFVAARFHRALKISPPSRRADIRGLIRELSRSIYLFLYLVIGIRQLVGISGCLWQGGAFTSRAFASDEDLQAIVAYGLIGLLLIRVLAFGAWAAGRSTFGQATPGDAGELPKA
jgi:hypothetical protein